MTSAEWAAWVGVATAGVGLLTGVLGILRYFNYRSRRDRIATVGAALDAVVTSLATTNDVQRAAAAIRLRRFFDKRSELGVSGAAYADDALNVIAAVLREVPAGNVQKLLADSLAHAPSLAGADLQRTNLRNAYLARTDLTGADLFQADLSDASLKAADARGATFYQSRLVRCVLKEADLRGATFRAADLRDAQFAGAHLAGARFADCAGMPDIILDRLDGEIYAATEPVPATPATAAPVSIFLSCPYALSPRQAVVAQAVATVLAAEGADVVTVEARDPSPGGVLADVRDAMARCTAAVVLGLAQLEIADGRQRAGSSSEGGVAGLVLPTPWNHAEAGIAVGLGMPLFRIRDSGVEQGVFDALADSWPVADLSTTDLDDVLAELRSWVRVVTRQD